jgi:hypothetical protein
LVLLFDRVLHKDRQMSDNPAGNGDHRVISFRPYRGKPPPRRLDDLRQFEQTNEPDDYRHRMLTNLAAAAVTLLLMAAGLWLADALSAMRKNQDCVLSGRRGCTPVDAPVQPRGDVSSPQLR